LLLTVLHHTPNPKEILKEASRVSKRVIIIEDIYSNLVQKYLTFFTDSLVNFEFRGHPHSNKSVSEWNKLFNELNLKIIHEEINQVYGLFNQALFVVEK